MLKSRLFSVRNGFIAMDYTPHILIATAVFGCLLYIRWKIRKRRHNRHPGSRRGQPIRFDEGPDDGFTCVMLSDGTTLPGFSKKIEDSGN
jgi:hypothetical protein